MPAKNYIASTGGIQNLICLIRGKKVMLDSDLAVLYGVAIFVLNQAVKRNRTRFPSDFCFQLTAKEWIELRRKISTVHLQVTDSKEIMPNSSQFVMSSKRHRGAAYRPFAFTEQGVAMLSSVLRSPRAVQVNIEIMRAFARLRQMLASNTELARKLEVLEKKYDAQFKVIFDAIRALMAADPPESPKPKREIGFHAMERALRESKSKKKITEVSV